MGVKGRLVNSAGSGIQSDVRTSAKCLAGARAASVAGFGEPGGAQSHDIHARNSPPLTPIRPGPPQSARHCLASHCTAQSSRPHLQFFAAGGLATRCAGRRPAVRLSGCWGRGPPCRLVMRCAKLAYSCSARVRAREQPTGAPSSGWVCKAERERCQAARAHSHHSERHPAQHRCQRHWGSARGAFERCRAGQ